MVHRDTGLRGDEEEEEDLSRYAYKTLSFNEDVSLSMPLPESVGMSTLAPPSLDQLRNTSDDESRAGDIAKETPEGSVVQPLLEITEKGESTVSIACQVCIPFLIAGMGMVAAGLYLDVVQVSVGKITGSLLIFLFNVSIGFG